MASDDAIGTPEQELGNVTTQRVYMLIKLADRRNAGDHTGAFPRVSTRVTKYIYVFYIYDVNFIKGITIKLCHRTELLGAYHKVYKWCESRGFRPTLHRIDNKISSNVA